ncbi:hypothetical protein P7C73_g6531, partial [Tremellales sp. Uapishka_1]
MPLSPIPIVIGTTLAVIGSGYAFKKFIYDPHLAPLLEAFLQAHQITLPSQSHPPVAVRSSSYSPTSGTTSARDHGRRLTRRRRADVELEEWGRPSGRYTQPTIDEYSSSARPDPPLVDLDPPASSRHALLTPTRDDTVLFSYSPSGSFSPLPLSVHAAENPSLPPLSSFPPLPLAAESPNGERFPPPVSAFSPPDLTAQSPLADAPLPPSSTFSILSLPSSHSTSQWADVPRASDSSMPIRTETETTMSYEDAESYTPNSARTLSPDQQHVVQDLGLSYFLPSPNGRNVAPSVRSLESEWSEGEWE